MLIVIAKDQGIINWSRNPASGSGNWGTVNVLTPGNQTQATNQLDMFLGQVGQNEPLCITGHGNDAEVGDEDPSINNAWTWTADDMAVRLGNNLPDNYQAPILLDVCCESVADFSARMVISLEQIQRLNRVWIYGYNKSISVQHLIPAPQNIDRNLELYGKQVKF